MAKGRQLDAIVRIAGQIDPSLKKSITQTTGMLKAMDDDMAALSVGFNAIGKIGKVAFAAVATGATAVGATLYSCIDSGKEFEAQMSAAEAISGASASEMEELKDKALELASSTKFTATEIGQAYEYMGMAGWKAEEMLSGIPSVLNLAAAAGEDLATTSDILTDDMTAFGMAINTENIEHFADVMAATATNSNTTVAKMGDTFKYAGAIAKSMGFDFEDVAVATGLMANAGIKASQAGTSLRSWMSRLAAPTKQVTEALDALGIEITDQEGNTKSFMQIIEDTRNAMEGLTDTEKTRYAAAIAGKHAMTGMLAVVDAETKDIKELKQAIDDCNGAAEEMAKIRLDNLEGDITIMKSAFDGLKLSIYEELKEPAREAVQDITDLINNAKTILPDIVSDIVSHAKEILEAFSWVGDLFDEQMIRDILSVVKELGVALAKWLETPLKMIKAAIKFFLSNKAALVGAIRGIATAFVSFKIAQFAKGVFDTVRGFKLLTAHLGPLGLAFQAATALIGVASTAIGVFNEKQRELIDASLDEHLGNVHLSMKQIEEVADSLIRTGALNAAEKVVESLDKADATFQQWMDDRKTTDFLNWKVNIGLGLSEDEKESYKASIDSYVEDAQSYIEQMHYSVDIAMKLAFPTVGENAISNNNTRNIIDSTYAELEEELRKTGNALKNVVNDAFEDGLLSPDETKLIENWETAMANINEKIAGAEHQAALHALSQEYKIAPNIRLDKESSEKLKEELQNQAQEAIDVYDEAYQAGLSALYASFQEGKYTEDEYLAEIAALDKSKLDNKLKAMTTSLSYYTDTVQDAYKNLMPEDDIREFKKELMNKIFEINPEDIANGYSLNLGQIGEMILEKLGPQYYDIDPAHKDAILKYLGLGAPTKEEIDKIVAEYAETGQQIPEEIFNKIMDYAVIEGMNGGSYELPNSILKVIRNGLIEESQGEKTTQMGQEVSDNVSKSINDNIEHGYAYLDEAAYKLYSDAAQKFREHFTAPIPLDVPTELNVRVIGVNMNEVNATMGGISTLAGARTSHEYSGRGSGGNYTFAKGGFTHGISIAGEAGTEAVISFDQTVRERNLNIWKMAGEMLGVDTSTVRTDANSRNSVSSNNSNITFSPNITINGNGDHDTIMAALRESESEFLDMLEEIGLIPNGRGPRYAYG